MPHPTSSTSSEDRNALGGEMKKKIKQLKREIDQVEDFDRRVALEKTLSSLTSLFRGRIETLEKKVSNAPSPATTSVQKEAMRILQSVQELGS